MAKAKRVLIDGKLYVVGQTLYSQRYGWRFLLTGEEGENCRTCPAFPPGVTTRSGEETLIFDG